jgi:hypothetical protein
MIKLKGSVATKEIKGKIHLMNRYSPKRETAGIAAKGDVVKEMETASIGFPQSAGTKNNMSISTIGASQRNNMDLLLTGLVDDTQEHLLHKFYRDIYYYDAIAGSAVDLQSSLPFSDFDLTGADEKQLDTFTSAIERLNFRTNNRSISSNFMVYGAFTGTFVYDRRYKIFTDLLPYDMQDCTFEYMPFSSMDPVITVNPGPELKKFLTSNEPAVEALRKNVPTTLINQMSQGSFVLDPLTTLYLSRKPIDSFKPTSYYKRILPLYILEKTLFRGTLVEAGKRQRSLLHVEAGDENWEPTPEELQALVALFQQADLDPLGPIIATRNGINATEARQGGDFWKVTDIWDITNAMKLRALGISETFLSGEQSYATAEVALSVFIENLKSFRDYYTQAIFYNKLFPIIAAVNNFKNTDKRGISAPNNVSTSTMGFKVNDASNYLIPGIRWHKSLEPNNDRDTMDMLDRLAEKNFPVTMRMLAAAGGLRLENIENELDEDLKIRREFAEYQRKVAEMQGGLEDNMGGDMGGGGGEEDYLNSNGLPSGDSGDVADDLGGEIAAAFADNRFGPGLRKVPLLSREFGEQGEVIGRTKTGKKKYIHNQRDAKQKENAALVKAMHNLSDPSYYKAVVERRKKRKS